MSTSERPSLLVRTGTGCTLASTGFTEIVVLTADNPAGGALTTGGGALSSSCLLFHFEIKLAV